MVHAQGPRRRVFIIEARAEISASFQAALANHPGAFVEAIALDKARARKVPKSMIGRTLTGKEVAELLERMG